jgi:hypothetical protein
LTWLDWAIGGVFIFFIFKGYRKGFVQQFFDLLGGVLALVLAFYFYQRLGNYLAEYLRLSPAFCGIIGFVLIVVITGGTVSFVGKRWKEAQKNEPIAIVDGGAGALFGGMKAAVILIIILLTVMALPWDSFHSPIEESNFANDLLRLAPLFYLVQDHSLPSNMPRLVVSPEGLQLRKLNPNELAGATCIACGHKVEYRGLVREGLSSYPQFYCPNCRRVSDGCLTFEGFHMIHGNCPYERFGSVGVTDCRVWPNPEPTTVKGKCPVCGRSE